MALNVWYTAAGYDDEVCVDARAVVGIKRDEQGVGLALNSSLEPPPLQWDPALIALGPMDALVLANRPEGRGAREWLFGPDLVPVHFDTRLTVFDDQGHETGTAVVSSLLEPAIGAEHAVLFDLRCQLVEAGFRLPATERVLRSPIRFRASVMPAPSGSKWTTLTTARAFTTSQGNDYRVTALSSFEVQGGRSH